MISSIARKAGSGFGRTDAGLIISLMSGAQGALEWRELRRRTVGGKEVLRNAWAAVPSGGMRRRAASASSRSRTPGAAAIGAKWFDVEPDVSRVASGKLLYDSSSSKRRSSWPDICGAHRRRPAPTPALKAALMNTLWKGDLMPLHGGQEQVTPLEIQVIDAPLLTPERWQQAQEIILEKRTRWAKTKREPSMFCSAACCACGRCGARSTRAPAPLTATNCSTGHP